MTLDETSDYIDRLTPDEHDVLMYLYECEKTGRPPVLSGIPWAENRVRLNRAVAVLYAMGLVKQ